MATAAIWTEPHAPQCRLFIAQFVNNSRIILAKQTPQFSCIANHTAGRLPFQTFPPPPPPSWDPPHAPCLQESPFPLETISLESSEGTCPAPGPQVTRDRQAQDCSTGRGCSALAATPQRMERRNVWALSNTPPAPLYSARGPCQGCWGTAAVCYRRAFLGHPGKQDCFSITHGACSEISCPHLSQEQGVRRGGRRKATLAHPKHLL